MISFVDFLSESKSIQKYKVRFHLGEGVNKFKWRVENMVTKVVKYYDPMQFDLVMVKAKLNNRKAGASKIHDGTTNKEVVSWIMAEKVFVLKANDVSKSVLGTRVAYNPSVFPHWQRQASKEEIESGKTKVTPANDTRGNPVKNAGELVVDIDKTSYERLVTTERAVFILKDGKLEALTSNISKLKDKEILECYDELVESYV